MNKLLIFSLIHFLFLSCKKQNEYSKIPIKLSLLVITPYEKKYDTGYAFEAYIVNNQQQNITFLSPDITIEKLEADGKWLDIFKSSPYDFLNRSKFYPNEGKNLNNISKYDKDRSIPKTILRELNVPINNNNLSKIEAYDVYMTFLKKDSTHIFSTTMNNVLNVGVKFLPHSTLKGKYRAFCKIDKERLFHTVKLWNEKNEQSEYDLPKHWGEFKFIENPMIKSDTIHFEIY